MVNDDDSYTHSMSIKESKMRTTRFDEVQEEMDRCRMIGAKGCNTKIIDS